MRQAYSALEVRSRLFGAVLRRSTAVYSLSRAATPVAVASALNETGIPRPRARGSRSQHGNPRQSHSARRAFAARRTRGQLPRSKMPPLTPTARAPSTNLFCPMQRGKLTFH